MKKAIYPGSFDPLHEGHKAIIKKALKLFDVVYVVVSNNPEKSSQTDINKRFETTKERLKEFSNVMVEINNNTTTAEFAKQREINFLIRSARDDQDFQYELELATANKYLNNDLETIIIIPDKLDVDYRSRLIKQGVK